MTHPFPTRRSSELRGAKIVIGRADGQRPGAQPMHLPRPGGGVVRLAQHRVDDAAMRDIPIEPAVFGKLNHCGIGGVGARSEEHTSELQSLMRNSYAVFCLKKKKQ